MQQLMHSFKGLSAPETILRSVRTGAISSFCLFRYQNIEAPDQLHQLTMSLQDAAQQGGQPPVIIGLDQEGGQLNAAANGTTELPGNMALGATRDLTLARQTGEILGRELLAMGVNMNFAPAMDVNSNPTNPVIGIRSFGDNPDQVAALGAALIQGMQSEGVIAVAKHFPGHGDTSSDSHYDAPVVNHDRQHLDAIELKPFRTAIEAGVGGILTAHIIFPALHDDVPATLSYRTLYTLLRQEMGFKGLILTDAMDMYAVARLGHEESVRQAISAGNDLILLAHVPDQEPMPEALQHLEHVVSAQRILSVRENLPRELPPLSVVGCSEHRQIAQEIADRSITVVRDKTGNLPLKLSPAEKIGVITVRPTNMTPADTSSAVDIQLAGAIQKRHAGVVAVEIPHEPSEADIQNALSAVEGLEKVVVGVIRAEAYTGQAELVKALHQRGQAPIVVSLRTPYDITAFPMIDTYLCAYGILNVTTEAVAKVLFGEIQPSGILPCDIPGIEPAYPYEVVR